MHLNRSLVLAGMVALACGGNSKTNSNPSAGVSSTGNGATSSSTGDAKTSGVSTSGAATTQGPSTSSTGGAGGTGGSTTSVTNGQGGSLLIPTGGAPATGGSGGDTSETGGAGGAGGGCDEFGFWRRVARVVNGGLGSCGPTVCREGVVPLGSVVFDAEGHVSGFTEVDATLAEDLMQEFETGQWACLAGENTEFCCFAR